MTDVAIEQLKGRQVGRYRLRHKLAEGGMATVWLAQLEGTLGFERWVAVKVVHPQLATERRFATMLFDEAKMAARIHHPHVCAVLDFGEQDGLLYLVMEYLSGETLSAALRRGFAADKVFPAWLAARIVADAARGLHAAHELTDNHGESVGLIHRDVSPQNIVVLYDGMSKVVDFGIAKARGRLTKTRQGEVKGKLAYMAPEQLRKGHEVDRRADVWALGVVLWEATLGKRLFKAKTAADTVKRIAFQPIPRPKEIVASYPDQLEDLVMRALVREPDGRIATAAEVADCLDRYLYGLGKPAGHSQVAGWMKRHFDDRLLVRQVLLGTPEDGGDMTMEELRSESTLGSQLIDSASWRSSAFDAPEDPRGVTQAGRAPAGGSAAAPRDLSPDRGAELDAAIEQMRSGPRRTRLLVMLIVLGAIAAVATILLQGCGLLGGGASGFPPEQVGTVQARRAAHVGGEQTPEGVPMELVRDEVTLVYLEAGSACFDALVRAEQRVDASFEGLHPACRSQQAEAEAEVSGEMVSVYDYGEGGDLDDVATEGITAEAYQRAELSAPRRGIFRVVERRARLCCAVTSEGPVELALTGRDGEPVILRWAAP